MRILSAAKLGQINKNEIRNDSNATTFTPFVSLIFRGAHGTVDTLRHGRHRAVKAFNPYWDKQGRRSKIQTDIGWCCRTRAGLCESVMSARKMQGRVSHDDCKTWALI